MTYEIYRYIFLGGAILSGIMLITSVILFIVLHIPTVIGDLTGANAKKAIESIRNQNTSSGDKTYKSSPVNRERGKLTDKISPSGEIIHDPTSSIGGAMATAKISTQQLAPETEQTSETTLLTDVDMVTSETTILSESDPLTNETTVLSQNINASGETAVLNTQSSEIHDGSIPNSFEIEAEISFIHTDEVIV